MNNLEMIGTGRYLPKRKITNEMLANELGITSSYIEQRTGIKTRFFIEEEDILDLAILAVKDLIDKTEFDIEHVEMIIVGTTSSNYCMPGISYMVQKAFNIPSAICLDVFAGCSSYINAFDIARNYITLGKVQNALVIGVDVLSNISKDLATKVVLADGAGATLLQNTKNTKLYNSCIESEGQKGELLIYNSGDVIKMQGKEIYRYAVTKTVENVDRLLKKTGVNLKDISYLVLHQSNKKIIDSLIQKLQIPKEKVYVNIQDVGNTFCASIPICLDEMKEKKMLKENDKILMLGYGGGLNTGSILLEI